MLCFSRIDRFIHQSIRGEREDKVDRQVIEKALTEEKCGQLFIEDRNGTYRNVDSSNTIKLQSIINLTELAQSVGPNFKFM